eukprot:UN32742
MMNNSPRHMHIPSTVASLPRNSNGHMHPRNKFNAETVAPSVPPRPIVNSRPRNSSVKSVTRNYVEQNTATIASRSRNVSSVVSEDIDHAEENNKNDLQKPKIIIMLIITTTTQITIIVIIINLI